MKTNLTALLPCVILLGLDFYLLPLLAKDTGTAMLLMLCVMPLAALLSGVLYGIRNGFSVFPAVTAGVLFIPSIFIYYNASAWVYAIAYAVVVLAGTGIGAAFYGRK